MNKFGFLELPLINIIQLSMKRSIIVVILLILPFLILPAQELRLGVIANPQLSWLNPSGTKKVEKGENHLGFDIGLAVENYFRKNYALLTGVTLCNLGGGLKYSDSLQFTLSDEDYDVAPETELDYKLQYVRIPIGLKFKTNDIGYFRYYTQLGFSGGINVKSILNAEASNIEEEDISQDINLMNLGYFIGGGAEYSLGGSAAIVFGITYYSGFLDVVKTTNDKVVLSRVALRLGIMF